MGHSNGIILQHFSGKDIVNHHPILVSSEGIDRVLAVPKLPAGTGETCALAVYESVVARSIKNQLKCLCFGTTSLNSGMINGACILLEQKMEQDIIRLPCRHHLLKIIHEVVVFLSVALSKSADIMIFKLWGINELYDSVELTVNCQL